MISWGIQLDLETAADVDTGFMWFNDSWLAGCVYTPLIAVIIQDVILLQDLTIRAV